MTRSLCCLAAFAVAAPVGGQTAIFYPDPPASSFSVTRDVRYGSADTTTLRMDIYRPAGRSSLRPVLILNAVALPRTYAVNANLARIAASKGLVAIIPDLRLASGPEDLRLLLTHLAERGREYGLDTAAITIFGASSNASRALVVAQDPNEKRIKAAVLFYGGPDAGVNITQIRRDLPMLYVRAGLDRPFVNASIDTMIVRALAQNAPITVINHAGGHHGFESTDDDVITRELIDQTVDFVKRVTSPAYRAALASGFGYATAAAHVSAGNWSAAASTYADLVARKPDDPRLRLSYGNALLGNRQFAAACEEFDKLKGKGLGPRDLGLPAASACLQKGDPEAAMAWLRTIPKQFLPARVKDDSTFSALKDRADFRALFQP